jgi:hypothetical protein
MRSMRLDSMIAIVSIIALPMVRAFISRFPATFSCRVLGTISGSRALHHLARRPTHGWPSGAPGVLACPSNAVQTNMLRATAMRCNYIMSILSQEEQRFEARIVPFGVSPQP